MTSPFRHATHAIPRLVLVASLLASAAAFAQENWRLQIFDPQTDITPRAMNDAGVLVGSFSPSGGVQAAVKKGDDVRMLGPGEANAINNRGQIVGWTDDGGPELLAAKWGPLRSVILGVRDVDSNANAINDSGQVVGTTIFDQGPLVGYQVSLWYRGEVTYLGSGSGSGINRSGVVAGSSYTSAAGSRAARWDQGQLTLLGAPWSYAWAINDAGQVVGTENDVAMLWQGGTPVPLGPAGAVSEAHAINAAGDVVGNATVNGGSRAMLWRAGSSGHIAIDINTLLRPGAPEAGWTLTRARSINRRGEIVGIALHRDVCCVAYGFVLSRSSLPDEYPVPVKP